MAPLINQIVERTRMYAVIASGGKQYKIGVGEKVKLAKIEQADGETVVFDKVLLVMDGEETQIGLPFLQNTQVNAEIVQHGREDKIHIIKFRRRKHFMKRTGHRQHFTEVKITGIQIGDKIFQETAAEAAAKAQAHATEHDAPKKATRQRLRKPAEIAKEE
jgi:large subunit ribosomal protein L21